MLQVSEGDKPVPARRGSGRRAGSHDAELRRRLTAKGIAISRPAIGRLSVAVDPTRTENPARDRAGPSGRRRAAPAASGSRLAGQASAARISTR